MPRRAATLTVKRSPKAKRHTRLTPSAEMILAAAKKLFLAAGFDGVNLDRLANESGVSRQTLYNQFGSKETIFKEMIKRHWSVFRPQELFEFSAEELRTIDPRRILARFAETMMTFLDEHDQVAFTRLIIAEGLRDPWIAQEFYALGKGPLLESFIQCLKRLDKDGRLNCPKPEVASRQFFGLIQEFLVWPRVMAIGPAIERVPSDRVVIAEAVETFMSRYGAKV